MWDRVTHTHTHTHTHSQTNNHSTQSHTLSHTLIAFALLLSWTSSAFDLGDEGDCSELEPDTRIFEIDSDLGFWESPYLKISFD